MVPANPHGGFTTLELSQQVVERYTPLLPSTLRRRLSLDKASYLEGVVSSCESYCL